MPNGGFHGDYGYSQSRRLTVREHAIALDRYVAALKEHNARLLALLKNAYARLDAVHQAIPSFDPAPELPYATQREPRFTGKTYFSSGGQWPNDINRDAADEWLTEADFR